MSRILQELHKAKDVRKYILAAVPLVLAIFAILINIIYGVLIIMLWKKNKLRLVFCLRK